MSLYVCEECGCIENTALGQFWLRNQEKDNRALCSECATGTWHGRFEKRQYDPATDKPAWMDGEWQPRTPERTGGEDG